MSRHTPAPTRRAVLAGGGALAAATIFGCGRDSVQTGNAGNPRLAEITAGTQPVMLESSERSLMLGGNSAATPAWLYGDSPFPVLRAKAGQAVEVTLLNGLK